MFKKKYRIIKLDTYHPLEYKIEERYTFLFFIHWWDSPQFAPPHLFRTYQEAYDFIKGQNPKAIII